jgi:hypothetical protein
MYLVALSIVSLPWLAGGTVALAITRRGLLKKLGKPLAGKPALSKSFIFGLGGLLGYLCLGYLLWALDKVGLPVFTGTLIVAMAVITLVASLLIRPMPGGAVSVNPIWTRPQLLILVLLIALLVIALWQQYQAPLFAWDALNYWAVKATSFIQHTSGQVDPERHQFPSKHPSTVVMITAWGGWVSQFMSSSVGFTPWLLCAISICLMGCGFVIATTESRTAGLLTMLLLATVPLAENHYLVAGYAEIWLAAVIMGGALLITLGLGDKRKQWIFAGIAVSLLSLTIKNTGPAYALVIFIALLLAVIVQRRGVFWGVIPIALLIIAYLASNGLDFEVLDRKTFWNPSDGRLFFGERNMGVQLHRLSDVLSNEWYSIFLNQSFSIAGVLLLFSVVCGADFAIKNRFENSDLIFLIVATLGILIMLMASQLLLNSGYIHATPNFDTGNSRFTLPLIVLILPLSMMLVRKVR